MQRCPLGQGSRLNIVIQGFEVVGATQAATPQMIPRRFARRACACVCGVYVYVGVCVCVWGGGLLCVFYYSIPPKYPLP